MLAACLAVSSLHAQDSTGGIFGVVSGASGEQVDVTIRNLGTGASVQRKPDADGKYSLPTLAPGRYEVSATFAGKLAAARKVEVTAGSVARADLALAAGGTAADAAMLGSVTVTSNAVDSGSLNPIDVTTPELSSFIPISLLDDVAINNSAISTSLAFQSDVSTANSSGFPRFNGSSGAENRYYVNEFDVTNDRNGYGLTGIPGEAMATAQIISDTSSAKYSNATGGTLAQTVKQGSNQFRAGYNSFITPPDYSRFLSPLPRNRYYPDGRAYTYNNGHDQAIVDQFFWVSGPILKDRLFFYVLLEDKPPSKSSSMNSSIANGPFGSTQSVSSGRSYRPLANLTWNITDNQQLDVMQVRTYGTNTFTTNYKLPTPFDVSSRVFQNWSYSENRQKVTIGNYYWNIRDDLTFGLMAARMSTYGLTTTNTSNTSLPFARQYTLDDTSSIVIGAAATASSLLPSTYAKAGKRGFVTWTPDGHQISAGAETYDVDFNNLAISGLHGNYGYHVFSKDTVLPNGVVVPANTPYVASLYSRSGGAFTSTNRGVFLQDTWNFADRWVGYLGVRRDQSIGYQLTGARYVNLLTTSPRLGVAWDVLGDGSTKLGATAGRYTLPLPAGIDSRVGSATTSYSDYSYYTSINADGSPVLGSALGGRVNTGSGVPTNALTIAARNLKNTYQNNFSVYLQKRLSQNWQGTWQARYDDLKRIVEDTCDLAAGSPLRTYLASKGYANPKITNACILFNPGRDLVLTNDFNGDGKLVTATIPNSVYGMPEAKRRNVQFISTLTHALSNEEPWFLTISYTWGHQYGNYEGYFDEATGQSVSSGTANFDYPQLEYGAYGNLSNDYRHSLKSTGYYRFGLGEGQNLRVGGNLSAHTGGPLLCNSTYPNTEHSATGTIVAANRSNYAFYCFNQLTPRGSLGRLPDVASLGVFAGWNYRIGPNNLDLSMRIDNITNRQPQNHNVRSWNSGSNYNIVNPNFLVPSYQSPRSATFAVRYSWN